MKRNWLLFLAGLVLLVGGTAGIRHGCLAERAALRYFNCKFGPWKGDVDRLLQEAELAHARYSGNHLLCILAAEAAYYNRFDAEGNERPDRLAAAATWCARGRPLAPYSSQLALLDTRLTAAHDLPAAIRNWERYVDWQVWAPYNHEVLVDLYARAGRYDDALEALAMLEPFPKFRQRAQQALNNAWQAEIRAMQELQATGAPASSPGTRL